MFKKPVELCDVCVILLDVAIRWWKHKENILHTIKPTPAAPAEPFIEGRMNPCFHVVYAKFWTNPLKDSSDQATFFRWIDGWKIVAECSDFRVSLNYLYTVKIIYFQFVNKTKMSGVRFTRKCWIYLLQNVTIFFCYIF